jgi:hypothetical protein
MGKLALLIGVSEYQPGLNPLPSAVKDVEAMRRVLTHPEIGNFAEGRYHSPQKSPTSGNGRCYLQSVCPSPERRLVIVLFLWSWH